MLDFLQEFVDDNKSSVNYAVESGGKNVFDRILLDVKFGSVDKNSKAKFEYGFKTKIKIKTCHFTIYNIS